ncbi:MAG TPA: HNH endonuclease signature motif containing protein, partial [Acidimicrobiia bacterium]|nr:HNH endonuclease signature motif containing protein [Acidimicrobiia bacterium]
MEGWGETGTVDQQIDSWQQELSACEREITRLRARQVVLIRQLDRYQVDCGDGARTMGDWTSARLDLSQQTSSRLTQLAHAADGEIDQAMVEGRWGLDRAAALVKLRQAGLNGDEFTEVAETYSLGRLYGLLDRLRHLDPTDETDVFEYCYLVIQPSLDESVFKLWGQLPGVDGRIVEKALSQKETEFPVFPGQGQGQRKADALTSICLDSLTGTSEEGMGRAVTVAEVFIDAHLAAESFGEQGATVSSGPRVGPNTLSEILCTGQVRVIVTDGLHPVSYTDMGEAIPGHIRRYVQWRDQNQCSIEGCHSRYRLQPHHIRERQHGGNHHPDNLITLCWYHHHVAIHGHGYRIDPTSPVHRRQL